MNTKNYSGFIKIWKTHKETGEQELIVSQPNKILYQGADLLAFALAGIKYAKISHIYVGYENYPQGDEFELPVVDKDYFTAPFNTYGVESGAFEERGYFRLPLSYSPTFQASSTLYDHNTVIFTTIMALDSNPEGQSADFIFSDGDPAQRH